MTLSKFHHDCAYAGNNLQYDFELCIRLHWRILVVERSRFKWFKHVGLRFREAPWPGLRVEGPWQFQGHAWKFGLRGFGGYMGMA